MKKPRKALNPNLFQKIEITLKALGHTPQEIERAFSFFYGHENKDLSYRENLSILAFPYPQKGSCNDYKEYKEFVKQKKQEAAKKIIKSIDTYIKSLKVGSNEVIIKKR
jgi:hypothetical protein